MQKITALIAATVFAVLGPIAYGLGRNPVFSGIRPPAVAGQFYPSDPEKLEQAVRQFLRESPAITMKDPIAIMAPHAGYIYSGQLNADAFRQVMGREYDLFIILGVNHTTGGFRGI